MIRTLTPEIEKALAAESKTELLARDPEIGRWVDQPDWRAFARSRVERGLAPAPRAATKPAAPAKLAAPPKAPSEAELARRLAAVERVLGPIADLDDDGTAELDRAFGLESRTEGGTHFDPQTAVQSFGAPAPRATKADAQRDRDRLDAAFSDREPGTAVVDDGVIQSFGVKRGAK